MPASFAPNYSQALHLPRLHVPGPDLPLPFPSVGVKAGLQGRLLAGTHRDSSPPRTRSLSLSSQTRGRGMDGSRDIRLYTGADWIGRGAQKGRPGQNKGLGWNLYRREGWGSRGFSGGDGRGQGPEPELARGKKTLTEAVRVLRMVEPIAKNLIRCHNYSQWRSTSRIWFQVPEKGNGFCGRTGLLFIEFMLNGDWGKWRKSARCFLGRNLRSLWCVSRLVLRWVGRLGPSIRTFYGICYICRFRIWIQGIGSFVFMIWKMLFA